MEPRRLPRKVYAPSQHTRDLCGELQDPVVCVASLLRATHRPVHLVPMRGDFLQRAGSGQSGCFEPLDDLFDLRQPRLEGTELVPKGVQLLRKNFALGALGRHRAEPILSLLPGDPQAAPSGKSRVRGRVIRSLVPSGSDTSPARRAQREVFGCRSAQSGAPIRRRPCNGHQSCVTNDGCP